MNRSHWRRVLCASVPWLFACLAAHYAGAASTKSFVLSYFYPATYYGDDTCPNGLNPLPDVFFSLPLGEAIRDLLWRGDLRREKGGRD